MNLFDPEQYQLLEELKALAKDINSKKTQLSVGIEEHNLSSYKKIKIKNRDDQKHAQQAIATLVNKCCKVALDKDAITRKLISPSSGTERGKLIDNCDKSLPEEYRQFINAVSYFYLSLNSSGVRSEEDKGLIFGQDLQGIGVTNSTSFFGEKLISIGSVAVHPSQLTDVVLQNMIDRKQYSKIGEGLNNHAEKLKFDTDVNFKNSNISSDLKDDLLKLMSFNSKEDDMDHGLYLTQLLNFFNTRSDLLIKGPQAKEFKEFFKQLLFTEALNKTTLEKYNGIKPSIITFLDKYYHEMIRQNNFANALYFLKLMILIESRIDNDFNCIAKINNLLETLTKSNDNEKLKILHQFRLAHFYQRKKL